MDDPAEPLPVKDLNLLELTTKRLLNEFFSGAGFTGSDWTCWGL